LGLCAITPAKLLYRSFGALSKAEVIYGGQVWQIFFCATRTLVMDIFHSSIAFSIQFLYVYWKK